MARLLARAGKRRHRVPSPRFWGATSQSHWSPAGPSSCGSDGRHAPRGGLNADPGPRVVCRARSHGATGTGQQGGERDRRGRVDRARHRRLEGRSGHAHDRPHGRPDLSPRCLGPGQPARGPLHLRGARQRRGRDLLVPAAGDLRSRPVTVRTALRDAPQQRHRRGGARIWTSGARNIGAGAAGVGVGGAGVHPRSSGSRCPAGPRTSRSTKRSTRRSVSRCNKTRGRGRGRTPSRRALEGHLHVGVARTIFPTHFVHATMMLIATVRRGVLVRPSGPSSTQWRTWWTSVNSVWVQPGNRHPLSRRLISSRWASLGSRRVRPSLRLRPSAPSAETSTLASQASRRATSRDNGPMTSSSAPPAAPARKDKSACTTTVGRLRRAASLAPAPGAAPTRRTHFSARIVSALCRRRPRPRPCAGRRVCDLGRCERLERRENA